MGLFTVDVMLDLLGTSHLVMGILLDLMLWGRLLWLENDFVIDIVCKDDLDIKATVLD